MIMRGYFKNISMIFQLHFSIFFNNTVVMPLPGMVGMGEEEGKRRGRER